MTETPKVRGEGANEPPPFLGSWRNVYIFVVCYLVFLISVLYLFSKTFNS